MHSTRRLASLPLVSVFGIVLALNATGCAITPRPEEMVSTFTSDTHWPCTVAVKSSGGSDPGFFNAAPISDDAFKKAVEDSLARSHLFSQVLHGHGDYEVLANLGDLDQPGAGLDMTVGLTVNWKVIDKKTDQVVFKKGIRSSYTATFSDAFAGAERLNKATEGAARENIEQFIRSLKKAGLSPSNR